MSTSHCHLHRDPYELPDYLWTTPSTSSTSSSSGAPWQESIQIPSEQPRAPHGEPPRLPPGLAVPILASASWTHPCRTPTSRQSGVVVVATTATAATTPATATSSSRRFPLLLLLQQAQQQQHPQQWQHPSKRPRRPEGCKKLCPYPLAPHPHPRPSHNIIIYHDCYNWVAGYTRTHTHTSHTTTVEKTMHNNNVTMITCIDNIEWEEFSDNKFHITR